MNRSNLTDVGSPALLLIEFQKQWTDRGIYYRLIRNQLQKRDVLENTRKLVAGARERNIPVIHAPLVIDPNHKKGWLAHLTLGKVFTNGTWKAEFTDGIYREGDEVVKGRYAFDAFTGSDLEEILKKMKAKTVFVCGFSTDQCVAKTMKTMEKKGFRPLMISDCTATFNEILQKMAENRFETETSRNLWRHSD